MSWDIINKNEIIERVNSRKEGHFMEAAQSVNGKNISDTLDDAMAVIFSKLDDAIDDVENGRVISEEELWAEIDAI